MTEAAAERLRRLLAPHHERTLAFARCLCRSRSDGDDLYQEALLRALAKLPGLRDDAAFRPWLYQVVLNVHRNRARRAFWRRLIPLGDPSAPDDDRGPTPAAHDYRTVGWSATEAAASARARAALSRLPAVQREAIVLFEIEGFTVEELAALQRVSISAVKSRLARGRAQLRAHYTRLVAAEALPALAPGGTP